MWCECQWKRCGHKGRKVYAAEHVGVGGAVITTSPALCTACLFVCQGEEDDEVLGPNRQMPGMEQL
jgi:hypothetical protein